MHDISSQVRGAMVYGLGLANVAEGAKGTTFIVLGRLIVEPIFTFNWASLDIIAQIVDNSMFGILSCIICHMRWC